MDTVCHFAAISIEKGNRRQGKSLRCQFFACGLAWAMGLHLLASKANLHIAKPDERASGCPTGPPSYIDVTKSCDFAPPPTSRLADSLLVCILINVFTPCKLPSGQLDNIMFQAKNSSRWQPQPSLMLPSRNQHKFLLVVS